uniref:Uncharacterized protein n=1 Tax=Salvator merianae TaxID=96440 RepID=A0A8D0EBL9_SALMN
MAKPGPHPQTGGHRTQGRLSSFLPDPSPRAFRFPIRSPSPPLSRALLLKGSPARRHVGCLNKSA